MSSAFEKMNRKQQKSGGLSNASTGGGRKERFDITKHFEMMDVSDGEPHTGRIYPGMWAINTHWIGRKTKEGGITNIPKPCLAWDPIGMTYDSTKSCPYCENRNNLVSKGRDYLQSDIKYLFNFLERDLQEAEPKKAKVSSDEEKSGFKTFGSSSWTPIRVSRVPKTMIEKCQKLTKIGMKWAKGDKSGPELSDPVKGRDIVILFDNEADGVNKWEAHLADKKGGPLSKTETNYLLWDIETVALAYHAQETYEEAEKEANSIMAANGVKGKKSESKGKAKSKKAPEFDIDELDDDQIVAFAEWLEVDDSGKAKKARKAILEEDEDELAEKYAEFQAESEKKSKKSKGDDKAKKGKSKPKDDEDDEDEDEDEKPAKKGKAKSKSKSKDDEDEDEPKSKKGKGKKFSIDDDDDEDEDEKPAKKKKGKK